MSAITYAACMSFTRKAEGGWTVDAGGPTEKGITFNTFTKWRAATHGAIPTIDDLKNISDGEWNAISGAWFWNPVHGDTLPAGVDLSVFDMGFNAGPAHSAQLLQSAVGVNSDGWIGQITLKAVASINPLTIIMKLADAQLAYYQSLAGWSESGKGWGNRVYARRSAAVALVTGHGTYQPPAPHPEPEPTLSEADILNQQQIDKGHQP